METLVRPLFEGPLDIIADVHGESAALEQLLGHLHYRPDGSHPERRRLVFLGDLTDRGPDSPAVLHRVNTLIQSGRAQCVLGNHDLNILLERKKNDNAWFFGQTLPADAEPRGPEEHADPKTRKLAFDLFARLPLALERIGLRIVHACWHPAMIELARRETDSKELYTRYKHAIRRRLEQHGLTDEVSRELAEQNENPVKVLTSGLEEPAPEPYFLNEKLRLLRRVFWWQEYPDLSWCVIGHYSRWRPPEKGGDALCGETEPDGKRKYAPLGNGRVLCIDYSVGYRFKERLQPDFNGNHQARLAALRYPEMRLVFDKGTTEEVPQ